MIIYIPILGAGAITGGLAFLGQWWKSKQGSAQNQKIFGPCTSANTTSPNDTVFSLPNADNTCTASPDNDIYNLVYIGPEGNPTVQTNGMEAVTNPNTTQIQVTINGILQTYNVYVPSVLATKWPSQNLYLWYQTNGPLNMGPQTLGSTSPITSVTSATALSLPMTFEQNSNSLLVDQSSLSTYASVYVLPGYSSGVSPLNWPATEANGSTAASNGFCNVYYIYAIKATTLFIELGGARGGSVPVYANGVDPTTGTGYPVEPGYVGGAPGIVYGLYTLQQYDVLKVCLGSVGYEPTAANLDSPYAGLGQGGLATVLAGANGGGASYVVHYKAAGNASQALDNAFSNANNGVLVCVAGGGGGASRNASGGSAGWSSDGLAYGTATNTINTTNGTVLNSYGSAGGTSFVLGTAPIMPQVNTNDLSGGGGVLTTGGASNVTNPWPKGTSSYGKKIVPFADNSGGSVTTDTGSGGGGGGSGYYGGGAGGFNGLAKPNNIHGGGGGGSSWIGLLRPTTKGNTSVTLNGYRNTLGNTSTWVPNNNGYLVLGLKVIQE